MLRSGRFRHRLLDDTFLNEQSAFCISSLEVFLLLWKRGELDDTEMAAIYILIFSFFRRPKDFLGGSHNLPVEGFCDTRKSITANEVVRIFRATLPEHLKAAKSLSRLESSKPFVEYFCSMSWRSIPLSAANSLFAWRAGRYPLKMLTNVPSPEEVLIMQTQGQRCISMLIESDEIRTFVDEGRDVLGFIIHDLIHADHFFADAEKAKAQIRFCQKLKDILHMPEIQTMLKNDAVFKKEFHYLMSDMNSVPLHLLKTLKAVLLGFFKRQSGIAMTESLTLSDEARFHILYEKVLDSWDLSEPALAAARRLNTQQYNGSKDNELLHLALS